VGVALGETSDDAGTGFDRADTVGESIPPSRHTIGVVTGQSKTKYVYMLFPYILVSICYLLY